MANPIEQGGPGPQRVPRQKIEMAMEEVAQRRREYLRASLLGVAHDEKLLRSFHAAILIYYSELRAYSDHDAVQEMWGSAQMWKEEGEWVTGVGSLERWVGRMRESEQQRPGLGRGGEAVPVPDHPSGETLRHISYILDRIARRLGLEIDIPDDDSLPAIRGFDTSREDAEPSLDNAEIRGSPDL